MILKKEGVVIYTGFVDPEIYEEEYDSLTIYNVEISTSSLAILKRVNNELFGMMQIKDIVSKILSEIDITDITWDIKKKGVYNDTLVNVEDLVINTDVFLNDDLNEKQNYYEILESIVVPFGAWFYLYDNKVVITDKPQLEGEDINLDTNILYGSSLEIAEDRKSVV